jgi:ketosteroid isomerase-like protein
MQIRSSLAILSCLLVGPFVVHAAEPSPLDAVRAMVESERKFYQAGQEKGTRAAFLEFLAEDGIVFRPGPMNGKEVWTKRPATGLDLVWEPTFAVIARSGDFGYDTGPAKWRANKKEKEFSGYGQFVSIWKKRKDGSWRVALDCGIENPKPTGHPDPLEWLGPGADSKAATDVETGRENLRKAQEKFYNAAKNDTASSMLAVAADQIRVYRDSHFPTEGKEGGRSLLGNDQGKTSFEVMGGDMSSSADLAYAYGKYSDVLDKAAEQGHYLHIWQTDAEGVWKLILDWQQPLPKEKPAAK